MNRARFTARFACRWCPAQVPERFREKSFPWGVLSLWSVLTSL